jgi:Spy/CpxP family protein refolding chaperone
MPEVTMKSKWIICVFVSLFVVATMVNAAEVTTLNGLIAKMTKELNLTPEQVEHVRPIVKDNVLKRQAFFDEQEGQPVLNNEKFKAMSRKLRKEMDQQLAKVLTPEQMNKLIAKQNIRESLNKDLVDFSEGLNTGVSLSPQGGSFQF